MTSAQHSDTVQHAVAQLAELTGTQPHVTEDQSGLSIQADVTPALTGQWQRLVDVLELGTSYGMTTTAAGQLVWLRFESGDQPRP
ncbi:hypothetical protein [Streptomyces katrae]|uniref:hypothetical protein n=1 Tax=Streptomyces katrae TaxID=68223 RepID=UPI000A3FD8F8|nr:hypothetical protein [Streptomyces katrae]